jgi:hypothetical protein
MADGLVAALARCQAKFGPIIKSHTNPAFKGSQYADVADVLAAVRPVLAAEGIAVTQWTSINVDTGGLVLVTSLLLGEERMDSWFPLYVSGLTDQQVGSKLTYTKRYQLCAILGVHPVGDDDDGNLAATAPARRYAPPVQGEGEAGGVREAASVLATAAPSRSEPVDSNALAAATPPDKPIAAMTVAELIRYAREIGVPVSGSKSDMVRTLEPYVLAASGEEPWDMEPVGGEGEMASATASPSHREPEAIPFEPKVAERLLPPDARKSVRSQ